MQSFLIIAIKFVLLTITQLEFLVSPLESLLEFLGYPLEFQEYLLESLGYPLESQECPLEFLGCPLESQEYVFDCDSAVIANFDGVDVELYDLSKDGQPRYYAVFQIGKYYITYTRKEGEPYDMIVCMDMFIREAKLLLDY